MTRDENLTLFFDWSPSIGSDAAPQTWGGPSWWCYQSHLGFGQSNFVVIVGSSVGFFVSFAALALLFPLCFIYFFTSAAGWNSTSGKHSSVWRSLSRVLKMVVHDATISLYLSHLPHRITPLMLTVQRRFLYRIWQKILCGQRCQRFESLSQVVGGKWSCSAWEMISTDANRLWAAF